MKSIILIISFTLIVLSGSVIAHPGGHGQLNTSQLIQAAQSSSKALTFKERGMSVGKLDSSWNQVTSDKFVLVKESEQSFIVKATNEHNGQTLYFLINKSGRVIDVKDAGAFEHSHGHSH